MTFTHINDSCQIGDTVYYQANNTTTITEMGACTAITATTLSCDIGGTITRPTSNDFILFSKDSRGNTSALRGYYAEVKLSNDESIQCELYDVGSEIFESSK